MNSTDMRPSSSLLWSKLRTHCVRMALLFMVGLIGLLMQITPPQIVTVQWEPWGLWTINLWWVLWGLFVSLWGIRFWHDILHAYQKWRTLRHTRKACRTIHAGIQAYLDGQYTDAHTLLTAHADEPPPSPVVYYLLAAQCAHEIGDRQERDRLLRAAQSWLPRKKDSLKRLQTEYANDDELAIKNPITEKSPI